MSEWTVTDKGLLHEETGIRLDWIDLLDTATSVEDAQHAMNDLEALVEVANEEGS